MFDSRIRFGCYARSIGLMLTVMVSVGTVVAAEDPVFSGAQVGEKLSGFEILMINGQADAMKVDPIELADGKPILLIFIHQLTRPGMALTRAISEYTASQKAHGVQCKIVWLDDDQAAAEAYLRRAAGSLRFIVPVGISVDGGEGPGVYGLNRNVELTILVANENQVTANFALVQPSLTEAARIAAQIAVLIDQPAPEQKELEALGYPGGQAMRRGGANRRTEMKKQPTRADRSTRTKPRE